MPADNQIRFDYAIPAKDWLTVEEVAQAIGMQKRFTEYAIDDGQIGAHEHNSKQKKAARMTKRIPRWWVVGYLVKTATYDGQMKQQHAADVLAAFKGDRDSLIHLRQLIDRMLTQ